MTHIYGHKWTANYGESAMTEKDQLADTAQTWATGLRNINGKQLAVGLHACIDRDDSWPPTLPEFKKLCEGKADKVNEHGLDYVPQHLRSKARVTDRSRLLSNDDRDAKRKEYAKGVAALRDRLSSIN